MIARLALRYLLVFAIVLAALDAGAYVFLGREYASLLQPVLQTPEGLHAYGAAMSRVLLTIIAFDVPLLIVVGLASWLLARASLGPLIAARERERIFAADAAHALRTPLATIASVAQARRADAPPAYADTLTTIARAALDASAIVGDLLTLARSAAPDLIVREPLDVGALVNDTAKEFEQPARDRGVALRTQPASAIVNGDERKLRDLTRNLLDNAIRHARSNVLVAARCNGEYAEVVVANDGDPIDPDERERIFERFYRAGRGDGSMGLGLAVVRWIAQAHGGSAFVRNDSAMTTFVVRLPLL